MATRSYSIGKVQGPRPNVNEFQWTFQLRKSGHFKPRICGHLISRLTKVQLTETDDADLPHLITDIAATPSVETDFTALPALQARLAERQVLPREQMVDGGYVSEPNLAESDQRDIDLVGPAPEDTTPQARMPNGLGVAQFQIDVQAGTAVCPGGHAQPAADRCGGRVRFRFPDALCAACLLRPRCCIGRSGRT